MGKKDLRKQYSNFDKSIIDYVSIIDPSSTNKLTPFLLKVLNDNLQKHSGLKKISQSFSNIDNHLDRVIMEVIMDYAIGGQHNFDEIKKFNEHLENNRIEQKDISQYNNFEDILTQNGMAEMKMMDKELSKQVLKIYEDSEWLVVKPLSFKASLAYGSGTKWCTAMRNEPSYFYRYTTNGILLYVINKINHKKFGFFSSETEFSVWNAIDNRIDSMESKIPYEVLSIIRDNSDLTLKPRNYELFSEDENKNRGKFSYAFEEGPLEMEAPMVMMEADVNYYMNEDVDYEVMTEAYEDEVMTETYEEAPSLNIYRG